jgi:hypothetical protein
MARQLLIIFLILSSEPVYAKWVSVSANNPGETMYVDPGTIRRGRHGDDVGIVRLQDYTIRVEHLIYVQRVTTRI